MKKILSLIALLIFYSCSTSSDGNGNSNTTVVPLAPNGLIGSVVSPTQVNLSWTDNSTNETGFKIERRTGSTNYDVVGTVNQDVLSFSDSGLSSSTTYTYRVYAFNSVGNSLTYSNEVTLTTNALLTLPTLTTTAVSAYSQSASSGGNISSDGGASIIARGVCWSTSAIPTIALTTKTTDGTGTGAFSSNISGLTSNTTYYLRAYATNSQGTAYGNEITFTTVLNPPINIPGPNVTDIEGNTYQSVTNCGLTFTKKNLNVSKYTDGTPIPQVTDQTQWRNLTTGAWCYYNNDPSNEAVYGKLYNWYAVVGIYDAASAGNAALRKKLAPAGWHIPTEGDWIQIRDCLGGYEVAGGKMKSTGIFQSGTGLWYSPNLAATNESGFTGLPGGYRLYDDNFRHIGHRGFWWSTSENPTNASILILDNTNCGAYIPNEIKKNGLSVRCVKD
jgi:uncharacterized protein (TIGR02145 family)